MGVELTEIYFTKKWLKFSLILKSAEKLLVKLFSNCTKTYRGLLKTSERYVPERRVLVIKALFFIASFLNLCAKVETSRRTMEPVVRVSMVRSLLTKTLFTSTLNLACYPWPTADQTPTALNFSSPP